MNEHILTELKSREKYYPNSNILKASLWLILGNISVTGLLIFITGGAAISLIPFILVLGFLGPMISLFLSKNSAKKAFNIKVLTEEMELSSKEKFYFEIVKILSDNLGLEKVPEVGIYYAPEVNAFATGYNRNNSMVAVSSELLNMMDDDELLGVVAHEMSHISNGDTVTMCILQGLVNTMVYSVCAPFLFYHWLNRNSDKATYNSIIITLFLYKAIKKVSSFAGDLVAKLFSRHREFKADKLAGLITDKKYIEKALIKLKSQEFTEVDEKQAAYACFKISSAPAVLDVFSTHPNLDRRINFLNTTSFNIKTSKKSENITSDKKDIENEDEILKTYLNVSEKRYLRFKKSFDSYKEKNGITWSWNWEAFIFGGFFLAYRKAYGYAVAFYFAEMAITLTLFLIIQVPLIAILLVVILRGGYLNYLNYLRYKKVLNRVTNNNQIDINLLRHLGGGI